MKEYEYNIVFLTEEGAEYSLKIPRGDKSITQELANELMDSIVSADAFDAPGKLQYKLSADLLETNAREISLTI